MCSIRRKFYGMQAGFFLEPNIAVRDKSTYKLLHIRVLVLFKSKYETI